MTDLSLAIGVIGVIAATFGLGCTTIGLLGNWREWAKTHFPYTAGLGRRIELVAASRLPTRRRNLS